MTVDPDHIETRKVMGTWHASLSAGSRHAVGKTKREAIESLRREVNVSAATFWRTWMPRGRKGGPYRKAKTEGPRRGGPKSRKGVRISLRQARELALRVMAEAERQTREDRTREILFLRGPVDEES